MIHSLSLRRRVTVLTLIVITFVLAMVVFLADLLFVAQSRADLASRLTVRVELAEQLVTQGLPADEVVDRLGSPGIDVRLTGVDGTVHVSDADVALDEPARTRFEGRGPRWRSTADDQTTTSTLSDGSELTLTISGAPVTTARNLLLRTLVVLGVGALVAAGVFTLFTTKLALAPLDTMTRVARSITRGDRGRRLSPTRVDTELGRTAAAFDAMLDELERL